MFEFCVLASGSKANCVYVASRNTRILVDCGLSAREAARRLTLIGVEPQAIDGIVITHDHEDHVSGVRVFSSRFGTPVYANPATCASSKTLAQVAPARIRHFETGAVFGMGDLSLEPFSVVHDAADPVGFRISSGNVVLGVVTDLGQVTTLVRQRTRELDALILESNHDLQMLHEGPYPWELKQRIASRYGHLSNEAAAALLEELSSCGEGRMQVAVAAHISEKNNLPELALECFEAAWQRKNGMALPEFSAASASAVGRVYRL